MKMTLMSTNDLMDKEIVIESLRKDLVYPIIW